MASLPKNLTINKRDSTVVIDNVPHPVVDMEFEHDGEEYVVFVNTLNVRRHLPNYRIDNDYANTFCIIAKRDAEEMLTIFTNLFKIIKLGDCAEMSCKEAFYMFMKKISKVNPNTKDLSAIINGIYESLSNLNEEQLQMFLNVAGSRPLEYPCTNTSSRVQVMREYIMSVITYDSKFANFRNLSLMFDMIVGIFGILVNVMSRFVDYYISADDVCIHEIGILLENAIFDRNSYHLFVEGQNEKAAELKFIMESKYPVLRAIQRESDLAHVNEAVQDTMLKENTAYNINLFPYILFYNLNHTTRIKLNLKTFYESAKGNLRRADGFVKFYECVKSSYDKLSANLVRAKGVYDYSTIINIFEHLSDYIGVANAGAAAVEDAHDAPLKLTM